MLRWGEARRFHAQTLTESVAERASSLFKRHGNQTQSRWRPQPHAGHVAIERSAADLEDHVNQGRYVRYKG